VACRALLSNGLSELIGSVPELAFGNIKSIRIPSPGMRRRVALVKTGVSEERIASISRVTKNGELGTM
jgi:hypothetical protein